MAIRNLLQNLSGINKINTPKYCDNLNIKISEFYQAMQRYNNKNIYTCLERINSCLVLSLQAITLFHVLQTYDGTPFIIIMAAFILAYGLTDFINGLAHMYMDNNTSYTSIIGPFISSFHLHHLRLRYSQRNTLKVYFYESGTKFWLLAYLIGLYWAQHYFSLAYALNVCLVCIGILSSVAEVSHFWCHNVTRKNKIIIYLQKYRILLSKKHHVTHHREDNTHYAFLNGMTDPLLNKIARYYYAGYKNHADQHATAYIKTLQKS